MKPGHVEVLADRETTAGRDFTPADRSELVKKLLAGFTAGKASRRPRRRRPTTRGCSTAHSS